MANKLNDQQRRTLIDAILREEAANPSSPKRIIVLTAMRTTGMDKLIRPISSNFHRWWNAAHGLEGTPAPTPLAPLDRIKAAEREIADAIRDLDVERDQLSRRIVEIDNLVAFYKKNQRA